jgi:LysR family nod box-dependent transcriptional activator
MRFKKLDLNLLVALDAMLKERSISRAAEQVRITQSAMSNALARLRDYFQDDLLVQVGRRMELTPRAELLSQAVHDVLVRVDSTIVAQPGFDVAQSDREFRLLVSDFTLTVLMPHVMALAAHEASTVRFQLLPQVAQPHRALERGETDVLIIPDDNCSPEHPKEALFEEDFRCVVWEQSRFANAGSISLDDYAAADHVVVQLPNTDTPVFEVSFMKRHGLGRRADVQVFSFAAAPRLVVGTDRVATVHTRLARRLQQALPIRLLIPPVDIPHMTQTVQWHKYRTSDPGIVWLKQLLHRAVRRMDVELAALQPAAEAPPTVQRESDAAAELTSCEPSGSFRRSAETRRSSQGKRTRRH